MAIYMAELQLRDVSPEEFNSVQQRAIATSARFTAEGKPIRYIRSTWVPSESRAICLYEAENAKTVQELNELANIPFTRIIEAVEIAP